MPLLKVQTKFFQSLFKTLNPLLEGTVIFGGDSNIVFDQGLDRSKPLTAQLTHPTKVNLKLARFLNTQGLVDIWRELNPSKRDYTPFSCPHQLYARIDHILVSPSLIPTAQKSTIKDTVWSDHSMVTLSLHNTRTKQRLWHWRLNVSILSDPIRTKKIDNSLK